VDYTIAAVSSWAEYWMELLLVPQLKSPKWSFILGLMVVVVGQVCRVVAMHTAKTNFSHVIMEKKEDGHKLVTHGIYA